MIDLDLRRPVAWIFGLFVFGMFIVGCDDASLTPPEIENDRFARYVALGNSITAGFQSQGITASTQQEAYPVLLAEEMGTPFTVPLLQEPGCPPPLTSLFPLPQRPDETTAATCALREQPVPDEINNVAVPGANVLDALQNTGAGTSANILTQLFLGGRTQIETAVQTNPTFASVWLGNNDVLGAALANQPDDITRSLLTDLGDLQSSYTTILDRLEEAGASESGILIGVSDPILTPNLSPGAAYFQAEQAGAFDNLPGNFEVDGSCAPQSANPNGIGESSFVTFSYGIGELFAAAAAGQDVTLDCAGDSEVLSPTEATAIKTFVAQANAFISGQAEDRNWAYLDPNPTLQDLQGSGIPQFPNLQNPSNLFGDYFSLDGVHPSAQAHRLIADEVIEALNEQYDDVQLQPTSNGS